MARMLMVVMAGGLLVSACGGGKEETRKDGTPAQQGNMVATPPQEQLVQTCTKLREQLWLCKEQSADMIMDVQAGLNPDFANRLADSAQRNQVRNDLMAVLEQQGAGDAADRENACRSAVASAPPQMAQEMLTQYNLLPTCWDQACVTRTNCIQPFAKMSVQTQGLNIIPGVQ